MGESGLLRHALGFVIRVPFPPFEQADGVVIADERMQANAQRRPPSRSFQSVGAAELEWNHRRCPCEPG